MHVLGTGILRCLGFARSASSPKAARALGCSLNPWSPDLFWPAHLDGTGCLSARAMHTQFLIVVWCLCLGLGSAVTLPFLAGVSGAYIWAWASALPRHFWPGFVVRAFGVWFCGNPATFGRGLRRMCLNRGFGCAPPLMAGVRGVCLWVWAFPAPAFLVGVWGRVPTCACPVHFPPPLGGAVRGVGLCGGRRGRGFSPPLLFFFVAAGGGVCVVLGRVLALWYLPPPVRSWATRSPSPLLLSFWLCLFWFFCRWGANPPVGCAQACPGYPFRRPFGGRVVVMGRCLCLGVAGLGRLVLRCSFRRPRWCPLWCFLAGGGCPPPVEWVCGFSAV